MKLLIGLWFKIHHKRQFSKKRRHRQHTTQWWLPGLWGWVGVGGGAPGAFSLCTATPLSAAELPDCAQVGVKLGQIAANGMVAEV